MKLSDSRTAKNIYNKGDLKNQFTPSIKNVKETSYIDCNNLVFFDPNLIKLNEEREEVKDFVEFFKNFGPNI